MFFYGHLLAAEIDRAYLGAPARIELLAPRVEITTESSHVRLTLAGKLFDCGWQQRRDQNVLGVEHHARLKARDLGRFKILSTHRNDLAAGLAPLLG